MTVRRENATESIGRSLLLLTPLSAGSNAALLVLRVIIGALLATYAAGSLSVDRLLAGRM